MSAHPLRICVIGAECTGKTTLCQALSQELHCPWVGEYLREFCRVHQRTPGPHEQLQVASQQMAWEQEALRAAQAAGNALVVCDGSPLLTAAYSQHYFNDGSLMEMGRTAQSLYHLTLLLEPDLPWVADGDLRDGQEARAAVHQLLQKELGQIGRCVRIAGHGPKRLRLALQAVQAVQVVWPPT